MPASAPRPVPTMIAVGVARPIAHGQAMTRTLTNAVSAYVNCGSGPPANHSTNVADATIRTIGTKTSRDPVGKALDGRLRALRTTDELDDASERRVAPDTRGAHDERPGRVERRPDDLVTQRHDDRIGSPVSIEASMAEPPSTTIAVDRDPLARADAQQRPDRHGLERHLGVGARRGLRPRRWPSSGSGP